MSMERTASLALDIAKEITVATTGPGQIAISAAGGEATAAFFEAVYNKVKQLADSAEH